MKQDAVLGIELATGDLDARVREQLVDDYVNVTVERVERVSGLWIELEHQPDDVARADDLLRELSTMKSEALMMGFADVSLVIHRMEELFSFAQARRFRVPETFGQLLLAGANTILSLIRQKSGTPQTVDLSTLLDVFDDLVDGERAATEHAASRTPERAIPLAERVLHVEATVVEQLLAAVQSLESAHRRHCEMARALSGEASERLSSELERAGPSFARLVDLATRVRNVALSELFDQAAQAAQELAREQGKQITVKAEANGLMVDRFAGERLSESLLQVMRNAVDHGIELPEDRLKLGKSAEGSICASALREGSALVLNVRDDGRGLDLDRLRRMAIAEELLSETASDAELCALLFDAHFSTRMQSSWRGIGLDLVRRQVEQVGGSVSIAPGSGGGAEVVIRLPV